MMGTVGFEGDLSIRAASLWTSRCPPSHFSGSPADQVNPGRSGCRVGFLVCVWSKPGSYPLFSGLTLAAPPPSGVSHEAWMWSTSEVIYRWIYVLWAFWGAGFSLPWLDSCVLHRQHQRCPLEQRAAALQHQLMRFEATCEVFFARFLAAPGQLV